MITKAYLTKIIYALMGIAVFACFGAVVYANHLVKAAGGMGMTMDYEDALFQTEGVMDVSIQMQEEDWEAMLADAISETYYACDVTINGTTVQNVGIRPKGNTSLTAIASDPDTDRYSFKLEFDHYVDGQSCLGLDKLILNNHYADATYMKEAIVYDMYRYLDADASLCQYAKVSVNGAYWGAYLALEAVEESFLLRNYGTLNGTLYKPEGMEMGRGRQGMPEGEPDFSDKKEMQPPPEDGKKRGSFLPGGKEGFPGAVSHGGADLNYVDDEIESYTALWEGAVTEVKESDCRRVVQALSHIQEGTKLRQYLSVDNVLKYMAVHAFSVNLDSLSGNMPHNYYLYEWDGALNILPWDYNLSFGGMEASKDGGATEMVNDPIDTPFRGTQFFDALLENESYRRQYHAYLRQLAGKYASGDAFTETYQNMRNKIDALVEADPTAFYTFEEYEAAAGMLYEAVQLRAQSVLGQLAGSIPSTSDGQKENPDSLLDASAIDLETMGVMRMGKEKMLQSDLKKQ